MFFVPEEDAVSREEDRCDVDAIPVVSKGNEAICAGEMLSHLMGGKGGETLGWLFPVLVLM